MRRKLAGRDPDAEAHQANADLQVGGWVGGSVGGGAWPSRMAAVERP